MFCPNCGADCGSGRFCSACGTEVRPAGQELRQGAWVPGMPCPQCGGTELEGKRCAFCGLQLLDLTQDSQETPAEEDSFEIPVGRYYFFNRSWWIELEEAAAVDVNATLGRHLKSRIPYDQITSLQYIRRSSKLRIHWKGSVNGLLVKRAMTIRKESYVFLKERDAVFYHMYYLLKSLAPSTAQCRMVTPSYGTSDLSILAHSVDLEDYFARYNPYRGEAVIALCKDTGMGVRDATALIDNLFDRRQEILYAEDPKAAVRDLNRIIRRTAGSWIQLDRAGKGV